MAWWRPTNLIPRIAGLCLLITTLTNPAIVQRAVKGDEFAILQTYTGLLLCAAGAGLLFRKRWGLYLACAAGAINFFPGYTFFPFAFPLARLALPPQAAWTICYFFANLLFLIILGWTFIRIRRAEGPSGSAEAAGSPGRSDFSPSSRLQLRRRLVICVVAILSALWVVTWTWGVEDGRKAAIPKVAPSSVELPFDPSYLDYHIMANPAGVRCWHYANGFSPLPFIVGVDYACWTPCGHDGRAYFLWFFGWTKKITDDWGTSCK
jgi:hypothetical protein